MSFHLPLELIGTNGFLSVGFQGCAAGKACDVGLLFHSEAYMGANGKCQQRD